MSSGEGRPRAREGLVAAVHSKRGRRYVSLVDTKTHQVVLLDAWEHAVLVLCDGTRDAASIARQLGAGVDGEPVNLSAVKRALKLFDRDGLIQILPVKEEVVVTSPGELASTEMQLAFHEWHVDAEMMRPTSSPFIQPDGLVKVGLEPTVAFPSGEGEDSRALTLNVGSTLVLAEAESLLRGGAKLRERSRKEPETLIGALHREGAQAGGSAAPENVPYLRNAITVGRVGFEGGISDTEAGSDDGSSPFSDDVSPNIEELLNAVDHDFLAVESREARSSAVAPPEAGAPSMARPLAGEAELPVGGEDRRRVARSPVVPRPDAQLIQAADAAEARARALLSGPMAKAAHVPEVLLKATRVGPPPEAPEITPTVLGGPRGLPLPPGEDRPDTDPALSVDHEATARLTLAAPISAPITSPVHVALRRELVERSTDLPTEGMARAFSSAPGKVTSGPRPSGDGGLEPARGRRRPRKELSGGRAPTSQRRVTTTPIRKEKAIQRVEPTLETPVVDSRARAIFERLRQAGLHARGVDAPEISQKKIPLERRVRRRDATNTRLFDDALRKLTAGDVEVAREHFQALREKMPRSTRLGAFLDAIESISGPQRGQEVPDSSLDDFEGALEEAVAYGRCPACFSMLEKKHLKRCFACGFTLS